jgi:hypothetical protein
MLSSLPEVGLDFADGAALAAEQPLYVLPNHRCFIMCDGFVLGHV